MCRVPTAEWIPSRGEDDTFLLPPANLHLPCIGIQTSRHSGGCCLARAVVLVCAQPQGSPSIRAGRGRPQCSALESFEERSAEGVPCPRFASLHVSPPVFHRKELVSAAAGADGPPVGPQKQRRQPKGKAGSPPAPAAGGWVSWWHPRPSPPVPLGWGGGNEWPRLCVSTVAGAAST